jgi:hypothetical protein
MLVTRHLVRSFRSSIAHAIRQLARRARRLNILPERVRVQQFYRIDT